MGAVVRIGESVGEDRSGGSGEDRSGCRGG